ncbi:hypothetical protein UFOVP75_52 [uncultured Caudovirales phage]|uniref:Uncharacterized protein n=1 Tax=uncultured Caudovirales phage TaxID=2100421 RepID=A0A6J5L511_9CAUD|nr:hypothetical protein UFOVP75_52 [uncultured Caudovirales phage]
MEIIVTIQELAEFGFLKEKTEQAQEIAGLIWEFHCKGVDAFWGKDGQRVVYREQKGRETWSAPFECWEPIKVSASEYHLVRAYDRMTDQEVLCWVEDGVLP